jgi:hypothetical protein
MRHPNSSKMVLRVLSSGRGCGAIFSRSLGAIVRLNFIDQELAPGFYAHERTGRVREIEDSGSSRTRCRREQGRGLLLLRRC